MLRPRAPRCGHEHHDAASGGASSLIEGVKSAMTTSDARGTAGTVRDGARPGTGPGPEPAAAAAAGPPVAPEQPAIQEPTIHKKAKSENIRVAAAVLDAA